MYVPQAQLPDAANQLFFRLLPMAWLVRTQGDTTGVDTGHSGATATGDGAAGAVE